jgi:hypothetical protein
MLGLALDLDPVGHVRDGVAGHDALEMQCLLSPKADVETKMGGEFPLALAGLGFFYLFPNFFV